MIEYHSSENVGMQGTIIGCREKGCAVNLHDIPCKFSNTMRGWDSDQSINSIRSCLHISECRVTVQHFLGFCKEIRQFVLNAYVCFRFRHLRA